MSQLTYTTTRFGKTGGKASLNIALLGPLTVTQDGSKIELSGPKRRALLILLALNTESPVTRDVIVEALWPTQQTGREESTLRVHVSHLRDVLEPKRDGEPIMLVTRGSGYMLDAENVEVDIDRFDRLTQEGRAILESDPGQALQLLDEALGLWRGRPLQDVEYEEFAQDAIRRLEMARIDAIENRAEALVELGQDAAAIEDLEALSRTHPTRERPARLLMLALYRTGRHAESLRVARRHARQLGEQGLDPSPQLNALEDRILQHDPGLLPEGMGSPADVQPGRTVRGYELREEAGAGSIGIVYRAFQPSVGREVAVKVINPSLAEAPDFVRRFAEEARVVAGLEHPHIVPLHDFWREPSGAFLVMRWMDGGSLKDRLGTPWNDDDLGRVFDQLADALGYAHSAGIVHRDVTPSNVLFDSSGNAYLCDFGLAVTGIDTGVNAPGLPTSIQPPYSPPELLRGEGPTVASDVFALGVLLAEAASGQGFQGSDTPLGDSIREVALVATSENPADRYPDMSAFRAALQAAIGTTTAPAPRQVRRNPYRGLSPFEEGDRVDFYGRDDVVETLVGKVGASGLTAIIGASGSGKSSVVLAGLVPQLRDGALPGSDEWSIVSMVPGVDPFDEFHIALRSAAVGHVTSTSESRTHELKDGFAAALDGPNSRALLVIDQFEELFSSVIDDPTREQFLDNLVDLATDPAHRIRVILTLRADFSDRPLAHPRFGDLMAKSSVLLAPMRPEQVDAVIRQPAARVGVQVEPGLIAEIVRDVASATAYLPLLQYVLSELFERRTEDRLTVQAYRSLGGVQGVLERRAEATFTSLAPGAQIACRQLFLRMVHIGDHGEETRRRVPLTELHGLGHRVDVDQALEAFTTARLLTYDRDPVSRIPTVEVGHETVIRRWARYRVWIDGARSDIRAHRRLSAAAATWVTANEDPSYLLVGGPLATALDVASGDGIRLNSLENRFVVESRHEHDASQQRELERSREEATMRHRSRRRLTVGIAASAVAVVIGLVAAFAFVERQRANDLAASQERQSTARSLAASSVRSLTSEDPELSLLLAIEGADQSLEAGEEILPEVVDALHRAIINPRPSIIIEGAGIERSGHVMRYSLDGAMLAVLTEDGGVAMFDPTSGAELGRIPGVEPPAFGIDLHPNGQQVLTVHQDGIRQWDWSSGRMTLELPSSDRVSAAKYSRDGSLIAVGRESGTIAVFTAESGEMVAEIRAHEGNVQSLDFDPSGTRLVSGGWDQRVLVWDIASGTELARGRITTILLPILHVEWHPFGEAVVVTTLQGDIYLLDTTTGERLHTYGIAAYRALAASFDITGNFMVTAGADGFARLYGTWTGGEAGVVLPTGGVPLRDAEFAPGGLEIATAGVDGEIRIWDDLTASELPARIAPMLYPSIRASDDGSRYIVNANDVWLGVAGRQDPTMEVVDAATGETLISRPTFRAWAGWSGSAITSDGTLTASVDAEGVTEIVNLDSGTVTQIPNSIRWATWLDFSPDGSLLAGAGVDGSIAVWNVASAEQVAMLEGHGDREPVNRSVPRVPTPGGSTSYTTYRVEELAFRPNGTDLASIGYDGTVRIWNPLTGDGRIVYTFDHEASSVAYSPDGKILAAADTTGAVAIFDADTGTVIAILEPVSGETHLVFSPDGEFLAGAGPGPFAYLWDVGTGRIVRKFLGAIFQPNGVAFVNGGTELRVASGEGFDRGYVLDPLDLVEIARSEVTRELTATECEQFLGEACDE